MKIPRPNVSVRQGPRDNDSIVECVFPDGSSCLISLRPVAGSHTNMVEVFRADPSVRVSGPHDVSDFDLPIRTVHQ